MTNKHTPGPWKAFNCVGPRSLKNWHIQSDKLKGRPVATISDIGDGDAANAQLISAAPELLQALQLIVDGLKYTAEFGAMQTTESGVTFQPLGTALAAIAKAKGEQ